MKFRNTSEDVAFSPDGRYLATANRDSSARIWDAGSGKEINRLFHQDRVTRVVFSPDGKYIATGSQDMCVKLWEIASGREEARLCHSDVIYDIAFSPDGRSLATACQGNVAKLWQLWPDDLMAEACGRLNRNLTVEEWRQYIGREPYRKTCPELPDGL